MTVYCIRGATTVSSNDRQEILHETEILMTEIFRMNNIDKNQIISVFFSTTDDLNQVYPAEAVRGMGLHEVALMCFQEMKVENSLKKCIRVGLFVEKSNPNRNAFSPTPIYLNQAKLLRPDLEKTEE